MSDPLFSSANTAAVPVSPDGAAAAGGSTGGGGGPGGGGGGGGAADVAPLEPVDTVYSDTDMPCT
jgi:hypothetical protein